MFGHMNHFAFGWGTPVLAYAMACIGSALGLRCTVRAGEPTATARSRRNWLITASTAFGSGIWTMHFVAMLGFGVTGITVRYNVALTLASLLLAVVVVGIGVFVVGRPRDGRTRMRTLLVAGAFTGVGITVMHYTGMAAVRLPGRVTYDPLLVASSVVIAVLAATAALWAAFRVRNPLAGFAASLVMGFAVTAMHYMGMAAVRIHLAPAASPVPGADATDFVFPLAVVLGSYLFLTSAFVALSPAPHRVRAAAQ
ncbi:hypothetical protein BIV57_19655 [Mangrovactinospora gilvigrisea]|uniref:MHYT domain-containing protein n=2 Tax=Mangrovactinospora gilvigrisea TaxID=1428644 RepID=A0A1J7BQS5_9ACTN|nr:hypothetical protein BIV57_19655 [Mangrovactinospora gilvigrisea]